MEVPPGFPESAPAWLRFLLKDDVRDMVDFAATDQNRGVPPPPIQKPAHPDARRIALPPPTEFSKHALGRLPLLDAICRRSSLRRFAPTRLPLLELAYLLWVTQGVRQVLGPDAILRTVPSAGNRHALETYLYCRRIESVDEGIYRYLPLDHELVFERHEPGLAQRLIAGCRGQHFAGDCAVTFIWTALPYRMAWRYGLAAAKVIALDAGHVCQNLYLACQAIQAGTCAIGAYDQTAMDALLDLDGETEFTVYLAPVGKMR
jgi:SagB-type dehydrogenase family enzyme